MALGTWYTHRNHSTKNFEGYTMHQRLSFARFVHIPAASTFFTVVSLLLLSLLLQPKVGVSKNADEPQLTFSKVSFEKTTLGWDCPIDKIKVTVDFSKPENANELQALAFVACPCPDYQRLVFRGIERCPGYAPLAMTPATALAFDAEAKTFRLGDMVIGTYKPEADIYKNVTLASNLTPTLKHGDEAGNKIWVELTLVKKSIWSRAWEWMQSKF